ncbi:hypothetical protein N7462_007028 [Penicillium macrosclerotiorum]|uniref:uncharacterized protein n=1 Tax=Penicillium macrosclerotiorum TaxID=303699 RepID=UPI002547D5F8|nr:uncharacterized protein N7462_007028 [Penicillium macrosclerotiorum]KAJ5678784.1 hypothetical protein N7462_007028 [Penicillium macrosclerotiorum]
MDRPEYLPKTSEIGSLTAHSNEDSQFVGSSSGVYFINTVKRAFSTGLDASGSPETEFPTAEDTLVGAEDSSNQKRRRTISSRADSTASPLAREIISQWRYNPDIAAFLGSAPPQELAKELMMAYFKVWHPLFPFLHGPTFLQAMESSYSAEAPKPTEEHRSLDHRDTCWTVILQCVFNLGSLLCPEVDFPAHCRIQSPASMTSLLDGFSTRHDITSLQALLAVQVYLVATMSLRLASTFGGCILRSMLHAGLHRCPFRYTQLSSHDRQLRKRLFWCAYAIDRYLSQALGLPLGIQDSDIDVCLPAAPEMHSVRRGKNKNTNAEFALPKTPIIGDHNSRARPENEQTDSDTSQIPQSRNMSDRDGWEADYRRRERVLASYVHSGTLTGRALELFHKSILVRSVRRSSVLFLVTDVHKWWNSLPLDLQGKSVAAGNLPSAADLETPFDYGPFFTVLYQHLILIINRPSLSLDPATAEFCSGLQTCIGAARAIISALEMQVQSQQALFWPGFLSAAWMSGLVLAFACQLKQYVLGKGLQEIKACSEFLGRMSTQWETARQCHMALSFLSNKIKQMENESDRTSKSHAYALGYGELDTESINIPQLRGNKERWFRIPPDNYGVDKEPDSANPPLAEPSELPHASGFVTLPNSEAYESRPDSNQIHMRSSSMSNLNGEAVLGETPVSAEMEFQSADADYLAGGSSFDLNMVDLLQGANFDSLFDMVGQRYPSF